MRLGLAVAIGAVLALGTTSCVPAEVQEPVERTALGAALGATLGSAIGSAVAINPPLGAAMGAGIGGLSGAVIGATTAEPAPSYEPIDVPTATVIPSFYDTWAPGYHIPAPATQTPPPPARSG